MLPSQGPECGPTNRRGRRLLAGALAAAFAVGGWLVANRPNFGVVEPGRVYRSAQPTGNLGRLMDDYGLKSVLNLRGGSDTDPWYADEVRAMRERKVDFYDLPLSATRRPTRRELLVVLDLLDRCRYPLLIHCKSGSDRTGLVSALYRLAILGEGPDRALEAFSVRYGHVGALGTERLHEPFEEYASWLKGRNLAHSPATFRRWVESDYRADDARIAYPPLAPGPRTRLASRPKGQG